MSARNDNSGRAFFFPPSCQSSRCIFTSFPSPFGQYLAFWNLEQWRTKGGPRSICKDHPGLKFGLHKPYENPQTAPTFARARTPLRDTTVMMSDAASGLQVRSITRYHVMRPPPICPVGRGRRASTDTAGPNRRRGLLRISHRLLARCINKTPNDVTQRLPKWCDG